MNKKTNILFLMLKTGFLYAKQRIFIKLLLTKRGSLRIVSLKRAKLYHYLKKSLFFIFFQNYIELFGKKRYICKWFLAYAYN